MVSTREEVVVRAPSWRELYRRREYYDPGTVPYGVEVLTAGVDVQQDRIEVEVVGWRGLESWSVGYSTLPGDPRMLTTWQALEVLLGREYPCMGGFARQKISVAAVDAGFLGREVARFAHDYNRRHACAPHVLAVVGRGGPRLIRPRPRGPWWAGSDALKLELYAALAQRLAPPWHPRDGFPRGWCHFPRYEKEYFRQLTAEELVRSPGSRKLRWRKRRDRNDALDCRCYALAALEARAYLARERRPV